MKDYLKKVEIKLYFAAPLFSEAEKEWNLKLCERIENIGFKVYLPQRDSNMKEELNLIFNEDIKGLQDSDICLGICDGSDVDAGTAFEIGISYVNDKLILLLRTDIRAYMDEAISIMVLESSDEIFNSVEDLIVFLKNLWKSHNK